MEVEVAKSAGFCFGVKRAVDMCYDSAGDDSKVYTLGPIIHNDEVVNELESRGVHAVKEDEIKELKGDGLMIIRSHGVSEAVENSLSDMGFEIKDATCPFVKKIHRIVDEYSRKGYFILVTGDEAHPEVAGICGHCSTDSIAVVSDEEQLDKVLRGGGEKLLVVSQTTFNLKKFKYFVEIIEKKGYYKTVYIQNTICNATEERQNEAERLSKTCDSMIVIGDRNSSNSKKLFGICADNCENTFFIQTLDDLIPDSGALHGKVGITAGASTPNNIIQEVSRYVRDEL